MPAHDSTVRRRWGTTVRDAVIASVPAASFFTAIGFAGGGYLTGREDVAACGAVVGAVGIAAERLGSRGLRVRARRERQEFRRGITDVTIELSQLRSSLADLRGDLADVRNERDALRDELTAAVSELSAARVAALARVAPATPAAAVRAATVAQVRAVLTQTVTAQPVTARADAVEAEVVTPAVAAVADVADVVTPAVAGPAPQPADRPHARPEPALPPPVRLAGLLPGQLRSPIATGGIPLLAPGPSEPVRVVDLRTVALSAPPPAAVPSVPHFEDDDTRPLPVMTPELVDALVYAAIAESEARSTAQSLVLSGPPARDEAPTLVIVRRGRHVA